MKTCFKCNVPQPLTEFYKHPKMRDGHLGKCKTCTKQDVASNYQSKFEQYQSYERERFQRPERKRQVAKYLQRRKEVCPEKYYANKATGNAIRDGRLLRKPCEVCGTSNRVEAHHPDYSKPLEVKWLCFTHHRMEHGQMTADARAMHLQQEGNY